MCGRSGGASGNNGIDSSGGAVVVEFAVADVVKVRVRVLVVMVG